MLTPVCTLLSLGLRPQNPQGAADTPVCFPMRRARRVLAFVGLRDVEGGRGGLQDVGRQHFRTLRATTRRPPPSS
eukprot:4330742-Prymnesium_polylepis.1